MISMRQRSRAQAEIWAGIETSVFYCDQYYIDMQDRNFYSSTMNMHVLLKNKEHKEMP